MSLQATAAAAPRGVYVCGNTSTTAGLTVSVVKDVVTGDFVFEAGALVLADRGACCMDEFEKMSAEHQARARLSNTTHVAAPPTLACWSISPQPLSQLTFCSGGKCGDWVEWSCAC